MIRTLFFTALLFCPLASPAQDVYKMVLDNATRIVNTPTSGYTQTQIAQFKRTALIYIKSKAFEQSETVSAQFLDTQAYYLSAPTRFSTTPTQRPRCRISTKAAKSHLSASTQIGRKPTLRRRSGSKKSVSNICPITARTYSDTPWLFLCPAPAGCHIPGGLPRRGAKYQQDNFYFLGTIFSFPLNIFHYLRRYFLLQTL